MASSKKSTTRKKTSGTKRKSSARKKTAASSFSWKSEVLLFAVLIFCVVLFVSNIGKGGVVGDVVSNFFFGLFGILSYAFPVVLFLIIAFLISNRISSLGSRSRNRRTYSGRVVMKSVSGILFFVFLCVFAHMVYIGDRSENLMAVYADCAAQKAGGGLFGAALASGLIMAFGLVATYVIDFAVLILCVVLITEKSLFRGLSDGSRKIRSSAKQDAQKRREAAAARRAERETAAARRAERETADAEPQNEQVKPAGRKKISGVSADTALKKGNSGAESDQISEVDMSDVAKSEEPWNGQQEPVIQIPGQESAEAEITPMEDSTEAEPAVAKKRRSRKKAQPEEVVEAEVSDIRETIRSGEQHQAEDYVYPSVDLLQKGDPTKTGDSRQHLQQMSMKLQKTLETFGVNARVTNVVCGPAVTQYEIQPEMGVKVSKIVNLADDIKLNLMVPDIRIEAPIPGKAAIGIEVPNKENVTVAFRDLVESREFQDHPSKISFCAGKDIAGHAIVADIAKMPHLLIAGATGSGKSVCINTIIMSILYKADPSEVKLIMIDPKVVELSVYNRIPHLLIPVVTDPKKAAGALQWAVAEMTDRYNKFAEYGVRDMKGYNKKVESIRDIEDENKPQKMPQIIVIVDELADLMMVASGDVEDAICRLAQLARAAGIHLIIATQRPSVNVITGLIKANMPSRIAFSVTSGVDSRTILDMNGAEKLLGKGDMLFYPQGYSKPLRVQGAFVSDAEVSRVVDYIIEKNGQGSYDTAIEEKVQTTGFALGTAAGFPSSNDGRDDYFEDAARFLIEKEKGSIGMLQRNFKIGFNRAARIMDQLEEAGVVGPEEGTKPRRVLMTMEEYDDTRVE
ncbi:MAG: DNA translocase FtsK [Clostridiales bacterium]|nr:DNA translocase FtsK [Clostridiales bacterium]